jgi:mRNA-degrading endonuclease RelE of RelBE toxin-antitoxin system
MNYKLKILPKAKKDLKESAIWYEKAQKGLGKRFLDAVNAELVVVKNEPLLFQSRYDNNKVILVKNFPYVVHYEIIDTNILIKAILHTSRDSKIGK